MEFLRQASKTLLQVVSPKSSAEAGVTANTSPCPHLLWSNTPPTESEISLIQDVVAITQDEESQLKEIMSSLTESRNLTRKLGRARRFIIKHNAILSAMRRFPPEILQNIFIHTLPTTTTPGSGVVSNSQLPWALSHVCHLWRITMLSFPVMWRDFPTVDLRQDFPIDEGKAYTKGRSFLKLIIELLKRSRNMPIRLTIVGELDEDVSHQAIDLLVLHSDRWEEIKIDGSFSLLSALKKIKGRLSSLQSLHFDFSTSPVYVSYTVDDLFQIAPQLRHVYCHGLSSYRLLFPTHQLVHYSRDEERLERIVQAMFSSPSLRNLRFHAYPYTIENTLPTALTLPNLNVLDVYFHRFSTFQQLISAYEPFFNSITAPALEQLIVKNDTGDTIAPIHSMILRSDCLLTVLYLQISFSPGELQSVLSSTPLVTKLSIAIPPAQDISVLMFDGNIPPLVPFLTECEFLNRHDNHYFTPSMETIQALNLLASSRCEVGDKPTYAETPLSGEFHPLQTLRISAGWQSIRYRQRFEGWADSDVANELFNLHRRLLDMIPDLDQEFIPFRKFHFKWQKKVTELLNHIDTLVIDKASDISISGIQYILYAIINWFVGFSFSLIAKRILDKWEPMLRADMPNLRWQATGFYLKYLSTTQNHALCSSPDAMKFFYYGLDDNGISGYRYKVFYGLVANCVLFFERRSNFSTPSLQGPTPQGFGFMA